jgi:hypothetical protein
MLSQTDERHRYSFYMQLRAVVTLAWTMAGWRWWVHGWKPLTFGAAVVAYLFNPILPVYMHRADWLPIDDAVFWLSIGAAGAVAVAWYRSRSLHTSPRTDVS